MALQIKLLRILEKLLLAGWIVFAPWASSIGLAMVPADPILAFRWFFATALATLVAVFLWDEVLRLPGRWRIVAPAIAILIIVIASWQTDLWIVRKVEENASALISQAAAESKTIGIRNVKPVAQAQRSSPKKARSTAAFSVAIEYVIDSFGGRNHNTGHWVRLLSPQGCELQPTHLVLFLRITNMQSVPTMITAFSVESSGNRLWRVKTATDQVFILPPRGSFKGGNIEKIMQFTQGSGQLLFVSFAAQDADIEHAIPVELNTIDSQIGDKYLEPNRSIRGWTFFQYSSDWELPADVRVNITDQLGGKSSYQTPFKEGRSRCRCFASSNDSEESYGFERM
jgi:hypothetical protein